LTQLWLKQFHLEPVKIIQGDTNLNSLILSECFSQILSENDSFMLICEIAHIIEKYKNKLTLPNKKVHKNMLSLILEDIEYVYNKISNINYCTSPVKFSSLNYHETDQSNWTT